MLLGGDEQLEQVRAAVLVEPVTEPLELVRLAGVHRAVALGVVPHEHLGEVGLEIEDVRAELLAVLEVELVLPALLHRHRELDAALVRVAGDVGAELLVHQHPHRLADRLLGGPVGGGERPLVDHGLRIGDALSLLGRGVARDPEELLLERPAMIEREDVELPFVAECHLFLRPPRRLSGASPRRPRGVRAAERPTTRPGRTRCYPRGPRARSGSRSDG